MSTTMSERGSGFHNSDTQGVMNPGSADMDSRMELAVRGVSTFEVGGFTPGYILFNSTVFDNAVILSQGGEIIRQLKSPLPDGSVVYRPVKFGPDGNLICILKDKSDPSGDKDQKFRSIALVDFKGNVIWKTTPHWLTHDFQIVHPDIYAITRNNADVDSTTGIQTISNNSIVRMDMEGTILWEWSLFDNLEQFQNGSQYRSRISRDFDDPFHVNSIHYINSLYIQQLFGEPVIVVGARNINNVFFVGVHSGKIVFELNEGIAGQHHAHIIPGGLPGENNLLLLDNGINRHTVTDSHAARVIEVDIKTKQIVWEYGGLEDQYYMHSPIGGSVERQPDGNTLVCEGNKGVIFEVTPQKKLVWHFIYPDFYNPDNFDSDNTDSEHIYRAYKFYV